MKPRLGASNTVKTRACLASISQLFSPVILCINVKRIMLLQIRYRVDWQRGSGADQPCQSTQSPDPQYLFIYLFKEEILEQNEGQSQCMLRGRFALVCEQSPHRNEMLLKDLFKQKWKLSSFTYPSCRFNPIWFPFFCERGE